MNAADVNKLSEPACKQSSDQQPCFTVIVAAASGHHCLDRHPKFANMGFQMKIFRQDRIIQQS